MANLTRAGVESQLVRRLGTLLVSVGLDGTTQDGTNIDFNDGIRRAVNSAGYTTADPITVADGDLAVFVGWPLEKLIDLAELRTLENIWGNWAEISFKLQLKQLENKQFTDRIQTRISDLEERLRKPYGANVGQPVAQSTGRAHIPRDVPGYRRFTPYGDGYGYGYGDVW